MEYKSQNVICQNCSGEFTIESEDFSFYEKIKVPPPTFCPECRFIRRMIWRNERSLYKRDCDMCKKRIIAVYDKNVNFPVYCPQCYRSDGWDAGDFQGEYDFSTPFFIQWKRLFDKVPRLSLYQQGECINSEYANLVLGVKNVYLGFSVILGSEDVYYSSNIDNSKQIVDSYNIATSNLIYENIGASNNYNTKYAYWSSNCIDSVFVLDCINCHNCFGCVNLRNKKYCIWNKQYTKEEYENEIKKYNIGDYFSVKELSAQFWDFSLAFPRKFNIITNSINSIGNELTNCKNVRYSFSAIDCENLKYTYRCIKEKDVMDTCHNLGASMVYEHTLGATNGSNIKFVAHGDVGLSEVEYADMCKNSSNLFGCIGLKNKQFCILNKQYEKEEYFKMVEKIKIHLNEMPYIDQRQNIYKYGEFYPDEFSPFGYNEATINDHFPLSKEEIINKRYKYKEKEENQYKVTKKAVDLISDIKNVDESVLSEVIECEKSKKPFKITKFELEFYKRMNIPLPHLHPNARFKDRLMLRNPLKLWHRKCMKEGCNNEFDTSYAPGRPEIVYCEKCYQQEVY